MLGRPFLLSALMRGAAATLPRQFALRSLQAVRFPLTERAVA